ncbi:MAG: DnaJ C-terminal domain-containing protein [Candidatus Dormibacteria bacterium]
MEYKDYYQTLGIKRGADQAEVKRAFRARAREFHPDVNHDPGAESRFKEINEAYSVLSDPEKRRRYDELGANWNQYRQAPGQGGFPGPGPGGVRFEVHHFGQGDNPFETVFGGGGFSDFFETFFGRGGTAGTAQRSQDLEVAAEVTLEEAFSGTRRILQLGSGADARRIELTVPPGVRDGQRLRLSGQAGGPEGNEGDIYVRVHVRPHPEFSRRGADLEREVEVPAATANDGGVVRVRTPRGHADLTVPAGTPTGRVFRLRGQGMPTGRDDRHGDLLARVRIRD